MPSATPAKPLLWEELKSPDIPALAKQHGIALLPVGSTEQHGPHLPLGTDNLIPRAIACAVSVQTGVPVLPTIPYAPCDWHAAFPGTLSVEASVFSDYVFQVVRSIAAQGFRHIIAVNGHTGGSNPALLVAADRVIQETASRLWVADVVLVARQDIMEIATSAVLGHADEIETSEILAIRPDLVSLTGIAPWEKEPASAMLSKSYRRGSSILSRISRDEWRLLAPQGFTGDPTLASAEKGTAMIRQAAEAIATFVRDLNGEDVFTPKDPGKAD